MRLAELDPRWVHPHVFTFRCPCKSGCEYWLSCKNVSMNTKEQHELLFAELKGKPFITTQQDCAWSISAESFDTMTVTPSLDFSAARHWHGFITDGQVR